MSLTNEKSLFKQNFLFAQTLSRAEHSMRNEYACSVSGTTSPSPIVPVPSFVKYFNPITLCWKTKAHSPFSSVVCDEMITFVASIRNVYQTYIGGQYKKDPALGNVCLVLLWLAITDTEWLYTLSLHFGHKSIWSGWCVWCSMMLGLQFVWFLPPPCIG